MLVVMQWANAFNARSESESIFTRIRVVNKKFYVGLAIAVFFQALVIFGPLQNILRVIPVMTADIVNTGLLGIFVIILIGESHKAFGRMPGVRNQLIKRGWMEDNA